MHIHKPTKKYKAKEDFKYGEFEVKAGTILKLNEEQIKFLEITNKLDKIESFYDPVDS